MKKDKKGQTKNIFYIVHHHGSMLNNTQQLVLNLKIFYSCLYFNIDFYINQRDFITMGIHKLMDLLRQNAPECIKKRDISYFSGMSVALDASMAMYQFMISTQGYDNNVLTQLTDEQGNKTGHLLGLFNRTLTLLQHGLKPVWVFDGKPPTKKNGQLLRRRKIKQQAEDKAEQAKQVGDLAEALKQQQRTTSISKKQRQDAFKMIQLMGIPVIQAPGQAQAQCSYMCKAGIVDAVGTQDMDALTFGAKTLLRQMNQKKEPITQITHQIMLHRLGLTQDEFIDLCILCGCDYTTKISGIGPVKAFKLIQEFKTLEKVLEHCRSENQGLAEGKQKYGIPSDQDFCYEDARQLFKNPAITKDIELKWDKNALDQAGLRAFLIQQKKFSEVRVEAAIKKIKGSSSKGIQPRLEAFFGKPTIIKHAITEKQKPKPKSTKKK